MIKGAKETDFAAPFSIDLQLFGDEAGATAEVSTGATDTGTTADTATSEYMSGEPASEQRRVEIDINKLDDEPDPETDPATVTEPAKKEEDVIPGNDTPEENAKWAQLRREAEEAKQLKQELAERDKWVEDNFGKTHGLHDWKSYQQAAAETVKQQAAQQAATFDQETAATLQRMQEAGYDQVSMQLYTGQRALTKQNQELAQKVSMFENIAQQQTQKQQEEMGKQAAAQKANELFAELQGEYPEFKTLPEMAKELGQETWEKITDKIGRGYSLLDAYESTNRSALLQKKTEAAKQKTLNDLNSKKHLKTEGDGATEAAATTTLSPETLEMYMDSGMTEKQARAFHKKLYG